MVEKLSNEDYRTLEDYVRMVLRRVRVNKCEVSAAYADIMHPLTAWDKGDKQEFVPYMTTMMKKWQHGDH